MLAYIHICLHRLPTDAADACSRCGCWLHRAAAAFLAYAHAAAHFLCAMMKRPASRAMESTTLMKMARAKKEEEKASQAAARRANEEAPEKKKTSRAAAKRAKEEAQVAKRRKKRYETHGVELDSEEELTMDEGAEQESEEPHELVRHRRAAHRRTDYSSTVQKP